MVQFKNRYLVMEVILDPNRETGASDSIELTEFNVRKAIEYSIQLNFGECGLASSHSSFQVKYLNKLTKICIIRVSRDDHQKIWAAITMVRTIGKCPVLFNLLDLSGCIRVCRRKALECEETKINQHKLMLGGHVTPEFEKSVKSAYAVESVGEELMHGVHAMSKTLLSPFSFYKIIIKGINTQCQ